MRSRLTLVAGVLLLGRLCAGQSTVYGKLQPLCEYDKFDPHLCEDFNALRNELVPYFSWSGDPKKPSPKVTKDQVDAFDKRFQALLDRCKALTVKEHLTTDDVAKHMWSATGVLSANLTTVRYVAEFGEVSDGLSAVETELSSIETDLAAAGPPPLKESVRAILVGRLQAVSRRGGSLWQRLQTDSHRIDDIGPLRTKNAQDSDYIPTNQAYIDLKENPLQDRVYALAQRAQKLNADLGGGAEAQAALFTSEGSKKGQAALNKILFNPFAAKTGEGLGQTAASALAPPTGAQSLPVSPHGQTLMDIHGVSPTPLAPDQNAPDYLGATTYAIDKNNHFIAGKDGKWITMDENSAPDETARIEALTQKGGTVVYGDPRGRAVYVFRQTGGTCAIASQVEFEEAGDPRRFMTPLKSCPVDPNCPYKSSDGKALDPKSCPDSRSWEENRLYCEAVAHGVFGGTAKDPDRRESNGTPEQYIGDLLGFPIEKHFPASDADLLKTVETGYMVIAFVDAGELWNNPHYLHGGHAVVVTGAKVDKASGQLLGYYVNDTGLNEGGRLVAASQFLDAWHHDGHSFVKPL